MKEKIKKRFKTFMQFFFSIIGVWILQKIYFIICSYCFNITSKFINDPQGNIIEHIYMFLIAFIITFILQKYKYMDFGYHFPKFKIAIKYIFIISCIYLVFSLIDAIFGIKRQINNELIWWIIFQLFFSGLGEEIIFRAIPINIFDNFIKGKEKKIHLKNINIDLSMFLSSIMFAIFHIRVYFSQEWYSFVYALILVFLGGIIYSHIYRKTNSIWLCMLIHGLSNVIMIVFPVISGIVF